MSAGVSGMSVYLPALRVPLEAWCEWTGNPLPKVQAVVGNGFRCCAPRENVYTLAANAVLRLIREYDVDPRSIGHLALATETSTDNSAGAVIVRGMVDRALDQLSMPRLSRQCEVPELKHACLAGVYGIKSAARYLRCDGAGKRAVVVCADIAEYERGSTGEQTQGAGAAALLLEEQPRLFTLDLEQSGSASDYRGPDFRKPHRRHRVEGYAAGTRRLHDFPVFSGKYSTFAYLEETVRAFDDMLARKQLEASEALRDTYALFFHRPYHHMPTQAMAYLYLRALMESDPGSDELAALCRDAEVDRDALLAERHHQPDLFARVLDGQAETDPFPATSRVAGQLRRTDAFKQFVRDKMSLGAQGARDLGNLYTAALFAWMAAGLEEAAERGLELEGQPCLAVGYGSGDAAEVVPFRIRAGWKEAAARIGFSAALRDPVDLSQAEYEALHDGRDVPHLSEEPKRGFRIRRIGDTQTPSFQDLGVEYYEFVP